MWRKRSWRDSLYFLNSIRTRIQHKTWSQRENTYSSPMNLIKKVLQHFWSCCWTVLRNGLTRFSTMKMENQLSWTNHTRGYWVRESNSPLSLKQKEIKMLEDHRVRDRIVAQATLEFLKHKTEQGQCINQEIKKHKTWRKQKS